MSSDEDLFELYTDSEDLTDLPILVDDDNATPGSKCQRIYTDNALNRRLGRVGLPVGTAVTRNDHSERAFGYQKCSRPYVYNCRIRKVNQIGLPRGAAVTKNDDTEGALDDKKYPSVYADNPLNRYLSPVVFPRGAAVTKNNDTERALDDKKDPRVYFDNPLNRKLGRIGRPIRTFVTRNYDKERALDDPSVFFDNPLHRKFGRIGIPMGTRKKVERKNDDGEEVIHFRTFPKVYTETAQKRGLDGVNSKSGSDVAGENVDTASVCLDKTTTGRMQINLYSSKNLGSDIKTVSSNQSFSDNDSYWHKCLALNDKRFAYKALRRNELPDQDELNELVQHFGRKSKVISAVCDKIASYIKAKDECIVDVWAAYKVGCNNIVFVIIVEKKVNFGKNVEYSFVKKLKGDVSYEGEDVINKSSVADMSSSNKELLMKSINLNNVDLMKKHKYLMMISGSHVRSKGFNNQSHTVTSETCIVLYVLVKGFIPIREDPFEKQYNGVAVDVREGIFQLFTGTANTYHEHLKNGCQIHREQLGTLGGFVDYQGFGTCGITCAHVLLNPRDMKYLAPTTETLMDCGFSASGQTVYQPDNTQEHHSIGKVLKAIYKQGGGGESGMDIALVKIDQRYPQFGDFPNLEDGNPSNIQFDSGKTAHYSGIQSGDVLKFGATTGLTYGSMVMDISTLSVRTYQHFTYNEEYEIILHNLLEIRTTMGRPAFAEPGDSGALVFCTGENNELSCVGVVEGGTKHKTCVVMPITPILQQLNLASLKCFDKNRMLEHFERKIGEGFAQLKNELSKEIIQTHSSLETRISQNEQITQTAFATILQKLNQLDQNMQNNQKTIIK